MKIIILAGGGGTRLFPLSRTCFPKQFLKLDGKSSLLGLTIRRFLSLVSPEDIVVVTNQDYLHHVQMELVSNEVEKVNILLEPIARNTAPAIVFAAQYCREALGAGPEEALVISPADHIIEPVEDFVVSIRQAEELVQKARLVTFGIKPDKPETGYGYIQIGSNLGSGYNVKAFQEKPDLETAERYINSGDYYWNSGMFVLTYNLLMDEIKLHQPTLFDLINCPLEMIKANFEQMPEISFDYAIAEKSERAAVIPFHAYWNDIGSWDAIQEVLPKDKYGNALQGDCLTIDCKDSLFLGSSRLIAGIGLEDVLVVETGDVILVAKKGESQKVKDLVQNLKKRGRKEASEHITMYRPWGSYTVLGEGPGYKMKKIVVTPGQQLSLQLHYHRSEHWVVIGGTAKVTIGEEDRMVHKNESVFIPPSTKHRLENPGKLPLEIIEVQNGDYLEEDDIVRFEDIYGRA